MNHCLHFKSTINNVQQHNHLGLIWNTNGTWKNHLTMVINMQLNVLTC